MTGSLTIRIDIAGEVREVSLPSFEEITLDDFMRIQDAPDGELDHETVARITGIDTLTTMAMKMHEAQAVLEWYWGHLTDGAKEWAAMDRIRKRLEEANPENWTRADVWAEIEKEWPPVLSFTVDGETFIVPRDLDAQTVFGQWVSFQQVLSNQQDGAKDYAMFPYILREFCLKEGEDYRKSSRDAALWSERLATMRKVRMVDAYRVHAFFFSTSRRYAESIDLHFPLSPSWSKPPNVLELMSTHSDGGGGQPS